MRVEGLGYKLQNGAGGKEFVPTHTNNNPPDDDSGFY